MPRPSSEDIDEHFREHRDLDRIHFPVLLLGGGIGPARDASALRLVTEYSLEQGDVRGMRICDSAGQEFIVRDYQVELDLGPTGITRWKALSYQLDGPRPIAFEEIRRVAADPEETGRDAEILGAQPDFRSLYDRVVRLQP